MSISTPNVNTTVNKLRQMLGDSNERSTYVQTIPRKGYSFISEVAFVEQPDPALAGNSGGTAEAGSLGVNDSHEMVSGGSGLFGVKHSQVWFTAGVIALTIAAMMLGAAITLFSYHHS